MGQIVKSLQSSFNAAGFDTRGIDGFFRQSTASAVQSFQETGAIEPSGVVDDRTWQVDRCLQLTAAFEGHGSGLAMGNFDGALLTWGIIGFTMASGEVQNILLSVNANSPNCIQQAFGQSAEELSTAKRLAMSSELALALCFDVHVQNGGIKSAALNQLLQANTETESEIRVAVANAVADAASRKWPEDVRRRKLAIANGGGVVHGYNYVLDDWGLSGQISAAELSTAAVAGGNHQS